MMSVKSATLDLLKIKMLWNKGCDVTISVRHIANKSLSCDSNYYLNLVLWPKIGNTIISQRTFMDLTKQKYFRGVLGSTSIIWD